MCHAYENTLEIMQLQGNAIITVWREIMSKGCILFLPSIYTVHTYVNLPPLSMESFISVTWLNVCVCMAFAFYIYSLWSTKEKLGFNLKKKKKPPRGHLVNLVLLSLPNIVEWWWCL